MSRGPGRVQYALLRALEREYEEIRPELFLCISTLDLGLDEHRESRRRAAHNLEAAGLIELVRGNALVKSGSEHFHHDDVFRLHLYGRLPYGELAMEDAIKLREEYERHVEVMLDFEASMGERNSAASWVTWYDGLRAGRAFFGFETLRGRLSGQTLSPTAAVRRMQPHL